MSDYVMPRKATVLVTGAAGYVGSHTTLVLLNEGYDIIAIDNFINATAGSDSEKPPSLLKVEKLSGKSLIFYNISTLNRDKLDNLFKQHKIDLVIHFAALKSVSESVKEPLRYYRNNISGTVTLLEVMTANMVKSIVFSSSATVYGTPQYLPIDEEHPTGQNMTNPYGQSKYFCEQILKDLTTSDKSWRVVILRYFNPVGAHESGKIGEDPRGIPNNLMPFISQVAVGKRPYLEIFGCDYDTPDKTGVRDYIHIVDLSEGHVAALSKILEPDFRGWKAYNLGTGQGVSVLEMVESFSRACGDPIAYKMAERRLGDVATVVASCNLAKKELGWEARKSLKDMCEDTWRWQNNNRDGYVEPTL